MPKFELLFVGEVRPDFFSWAIQYACGRIHRRRVNFSHVAILVDGQRVFDSTGRGFDETTLENLLKGGSAVVRHRFWLAVSSHNEDAATAWLEGRKGVGYARLQILGLLFPILRRVPLIRNGFRRAFCSETGADFVRRWCLLAHADKRLDDDRRDWIDPYALYLIAPSYGPEVTEP